MRENRTTFINRLIPHFTQDDIDLIMFAYDLSKEAHRPARRHCGERYFEHPRAGCLILMDELGVYDKNLIIGFLLHDAGEDTPIFGNVTVGWAQFVATARFRIGIIFGAEVADIVIRLTKPYIDTEGSAGKVVEFATKEAMMDYYLGELVASEDANVLKAVDRLHNLRTTPPRKLGRVAKITRETEDLLLPVFRQVQGTRAELMDRVIQKVLVAMEALVQPVEADH